MKCNKSLRSIEQVTKNLRNVILKFNLNPKKQERISNYIARMILHWIHEFILKKQFLYRLRCDFKLLGKEVVDYIADYLANIRSRRVYPAVSPGYLRNVLPTSAPVDGEPWEDIFADIERCIMPGVTHWQSPHMHAYFPALNSPASLLADMLADAINCLGFTWVRTIMWISHTCRVKWFSLLCFLLFGLKLLSCVMYLTILY